MICLMSKMDLIKTSGGGTGKGIRGQHKIGKEIGRYLDPDPMLLLEDINQETNPKFHALNQAVVDLVCALNCENCRRRAESSRCSRYKITTLFRSCRWMSQTKTP